MNNKIISAFIAIFTIILSLSSCDKVEEEIISINNLPTAAQTTINSSFDAEQISLITYEKDFLDHEYTVLFIDGTSIDFNKNGEWETIKSNVTGVPSSVMPSKIAEYLSNNYADYKVTEIEKDNNNYDVTLSQLIELTFNSSGELIGADID
ncbi:MAG: PepSY-like domain-containing protein [Bacteroidales bacterium]